MFGMWNKEYATPADLSSRIIIDRICSYLIKTDSWTGLCSGTLEGEQMVVVVVI